MVTSEDKPIPDVPDASEINALSKTLGVDQDGNVVLYNLELLTRNNIGQLKITDATPAPPLLNQNYDLIGTAMGASPSGTYANLHGAGGAGIVIPLPAAGNGIFEAKAIWKGAFWEPFWMEKLLPSTDLSGVVKYNDLTAAFGNGEINNYGYTTDIPTVSATANLSIFNSSDPILTPGVVTSVKVKVSNTNNIKIHIVRLVSGIGYKTVASQTFTPVIGLNTFTTNLAAQAGDFVAVWYGSNFSYFSSAIAGRSFKYATGDVSAVNTAFTDSTGAVQLSFTVTGVISPKVLNDDVSTLKSGEFSNTTSHVYGYTPDIAGASITGNLCIFNSSDPVSQAGKAVSVTVKCVNTNVIKVHQIRLVSGNNYKTVASQTFTPVVGLNTFEVGFDVLVGDFIGVWYGTNFSYYSTGIAGHNFAYLTGDMSGVSSAFTPSTGAVQLSFLVEQGVTVDLFVQSTKIATNEQAIVVLQSQINAAKNYGNLLYEEKLGAVLNSKWVNNGTWTPSAGGLTSTSAGVSNYIILNNQYNADARFTKVHVILQANTHFALVYATKETLKSGGTIASVNCNNSTLNFYQSWENNNTSLSVRSSAAIPAVVAGRTYILELERNIRTNKVRLTDTITGITTELVETPTEYYIGNFNNVFAGGMQFDTPGFMHISGTTPTITKFKVYTKKTGPKIYAVGDSITVGYGVDTPSCFADMLRTALNGDCIVSGRNGGRIDAVIEKITTEAAILQPKYVMVTIGTNTGNTLAKLQQLVALIRSINAIPIINTIPYKAGISTVTNPDIRSLGVLGAQFDMATCINNDITQVGDSTKFKDDVTHPNEAGHQGMFNRLFIDIPEIFY